MNAREVLVTGRTGVLGRRVVERLGSAGIEARVLSRSGRSGTVKGDLLTGEGLARAVRGVDTVLHCASSSLRKTRRTDVGGTGRLLDAAERAGVSHLVYISIVGIDRVQSYPYYRAKLDAERIVEGSPVPHTILRATQFYDLVFGAMRALDKLPVMLVPRGLVGQPIDAGEVAGRMVELAFDGPAGRAPDVGGPGVWTMAEAARGYLCATGRKRKLLEVPLPGKTARAFRSGALTCPQNAYGRITWEEFLQENVRGR